LSRHAIGKEIRVTIDQARERRDLALEHHREIVAVDALNDSDRLGSRLRVSLG